MEWLAHQARECRPALVLAFIGCISFGFVNPLAPENHFMWWFDAGYSCAFALSLCMQVRPKESIRELVNVQCATDLLVVVLSIVALSSGASLPYRPLRVLQLLVRVRGLRVVSRALINVVQKGRPVWIFAATVLFLVVASGIVLFRGRLRHSCHVFDASTRIWTSTGAACDPGCTWDGMGTPTCSALGEKLPRQTSPARQTSRAAHETSWWKGTHTCEPGMRCLCRATAAADPTCTALDSPGHGATSFDTLASAILTGFSFLTGEGWLPTMHALMASVSMFAAPFCVLLVLLGRLLILPIIRRSVCDQFEMGDPEASSAAEKEEKAGDAPKQEKGDAETPKRDESAMCTAARCLVSHRHWQRLVQACYVADLLLRASSAADSPPSSLRSSWAVGRWASLVETAGGGVVDAVLCLDLVGCLVAYKVISKLNAVTLAVSIATRLLPSGTVPAAARALVPLRALNIAHASDGLVSALLQTEFTITIVLTTLKKSFLRMIYFWLLLVMLVLCFATLGMELFGGFFPRPELNYTRHALPGVWAERRITWPQPLPSRFHFDDFGTSVLTCIIAILGESWLDVIHDVHRASEAYYADAGCAFVAIAFFLVLIFFGNVIFFNLAVAVLLSAFEDDDKQEEGITAEDDEKQEEEITAEDDEKQEEGITAELRGEEDEEEEHSGGGGMPMLAFRFGALRNAQNWPPKEGSEIGNTKSEPEPIARATASERAVLVLVAASVFTLVVDSPFVPPTPGLYALECLVAAGYAAEAIARVATTGPGSYLQTNPLSAFNALVSVLSLFPLPVVGGLRAFRVLRLAHLVTPFQLHLFMRALPSARHLMAVVVFGHLMGSLIALELFKGRLGYCMDPRYAHLPHGSRVVPGMSGNQTDYDECMSLSR